MENWIETDTSDTLEFKDKSHWFNAQKKWLKKKEFWRAVIYALTRPDDYKPILLEKALKEKDLCEIVLREIADYGENAGFVSKPMQKEK